MKSFKKLNDQLNEHHGGGIDLQSQYGSTPPGLLDVGGAVSLFAIENPRIVDRLNAAISHITSRTTSSPDAVICDIKDKILVHAGLSCEKYYGLEEGSYRMPLKQFNGRMGATPEEGVLNSGDDGITHKLGHGLDLLVTVVKELNSLYMVDAIIVPSEDNNMMGDASYTE